MVINVNELQEGLRTKRFGKRIVFLREVDSTNNVAKELASYGAVEGTVVIAEAQTVGRGRLNRKWISPKGGLYFSIILRPKTNSSEAVKLVFVAGLAVAETLRELYHSKVETKWPNDVLVGGRKVCGILSEMRTTNERVGFVVIGIGVNANFDVKKDIPRELWGSAISLENELGKKVNLEELFRVLLEKLENVYDSFLKEGFAPVLEKWKAFASFLGQKVTVISETGELAGLALDVKDDGSLIVKLEDGKEKRILVGDVSMR